MLKNYFAPLACGDISFRPYVVGADGSPLSLDYTAKLTSDGARVTLSANDGRVSDAIYITRDGDEYRCKRVFENNTDEIVTICELALDIGGITFGGVSRDDYFYHNENPRIYEAMTFPIDYDRTAEDAKDSEFDIEAGNRWADPGVISERIGASPYQPFPAILLSNYKTNVGLVHGTLSQKVFFHNYLASHENGTVTLTVFSSFKATKTLELAPGRVLIDEWYLGRTENADDIERIFEKYANVLRTVLPANYGATDINRDNLVWGTWNDGIFRNISEDMVLRETRFLKDNFPTMRWIQIDDGYHAYPRDAIGIGVPYEGEDGVHREKFPNGLRHLTDGIREIGLRPAIWIGLKAPNFTKLYLENPDWFVDYSFRVSFGVLDVSKPEVRDYMLYAVNVLCRKYGFESVKHDFWSYAFEDSHDLYANKDKSGYEYRDWWTKEIRSAIPTDGYFQTGCDIVMGNPFLGERFTNYRYGIDIGSGNWDHVKTNYLWGAACFATHTGDLFVPNSDAVGLFPGLSETEAMFSINFCLVTHSMVEIAGKLSEATDMERLRVLKKAVCAPNNGQDVYFVGYDYRCNHYSVPEAMYFTSPHFSKLEGCGLMPLCTVGLFNVDEEDKTLGFTASDLGLCDGDYRLIDVWSGEEYDLGEGFAVAVVPHGSRLLAVCDKRTAKLYDANIRVVSIAATENGVALECDYDARDVELTFADAVKCVKQNGVALDCEIDGRRVKCKATAKGIIEVEF